MSTYREYVPWKPGDQARDALRRASRIVSDFQAQGYTLTLRQLPNPTKLTDSRARGYIHAHGRECWELDALSPAVLDELIERHILSEVDSARYDAAREVMETERETLNEAAARWAEVVEHLEGA